MGFISEPNFIIGGTACGGTSFLSAILVQHPQIYLPVKMRPEPHFFFKSWEYKKGLDYYKKTWFKAVKKSHLAIGERSSSYLFGGQKVAEKISMVYPNMKFIFILRNPIERTWANYRFTVLQGLENLPFFEALKQEKKRVKEQKGIWSEIQPFNYTGRGFYGTQILEFQKHFSKDNILLLKSENLAKNTKKELDKIYKFLELSCYDYNYELPADYTSVNVIDQILQMELRKYFGREFDKIIELIRKKEPLEVFKKSKIDAKKITQLESNLVENKLPIAQEDRFYLQNLFLDDLSKLMGIVDFDITDWS